MHKINFIPQLIFEMLNLHNQFITLIICSFNTYVSACKKQKIKFIPPIVFEILRFKNRAI